MKTLLGLSAFIVVASLATTVNAQTSKEIGDKGHVSRTEPSDKYGPGGKHETISAGYVVLEERYWDKCGRIRESYQADDHGKKYTTSYFDENGKHAVTVYYRAGKGGADNYYISKEKGRSDSKEAKALIAKLEETPSAPCPEKGEQANEQPQPKGKSPVKSIFDSVHIGIGIGGGHTVGHDEHGRSGKSTGYKSLPAGCKCRPSCTCAPTCTCH